MQPVPRLPKRVVEGRLAEWRPMMRSSPTQARAVIQRTLRGRIVFTPSEGTGDFEGQPVTGPGYRFAVETRFDKLLAGVVCERPVWMKDYEGEVTGAEGITTANTRDGDYGRLLERAYVKVVASPKGLDPFRVNGTALVRALTRVGLR